MQQILKKYEGREIGINLEQTYHVETATLTAVQADYFSVMGTRDDSLHHIPYQRIAQLVENPDGVKTGGLFQQKHYYSLVIKIAHVMEPVVA